MSVYYKIWVGAITLAKKKAGQGGSWKLLTIIPISLLNGINLFTLLLWLRALSSKELPVLFPMEIFSVKPLNSFFSVVIVFFIPFIILNYLLIFNNQRYIHLLRMYSGKGGKLYFRYICISVGILAIPFVLQWLF